MNSENNARKVAAVLAHPSILRGAWLRVDAWYKHGELAPQPELARWRLHPEAMLRDLAQRLREDDWKPELWRQVPYPKKGRCLRHYTMPTVRDQVAFMAHMVALGPILDQQFANFAFGNRWYRPIAWDRRQHPPRWVHRPYPVLTDRSYLSYARSHGLFRRVAHWTVARMTQATLPAEDSSGRMLRPEDYQDGTLPEWTKPEWWTGAVNSARAFWAYLDIELAYPSVRIERLALAMERALLQPVQLVQLEQLYDGCPEPVLKALAITDVRVEVGRRLTTTLGEITLDAGGIPPDAWSPPQGHDFPSVTTERFNGIPTGLIISGMLLNVALMEADRVIRRYLEQTSGKRRGAIVRFADDMYILSRSSEGLLSLVEAVHGALSGTEESSLAVPNEVSNICINLRKIKPDAVRGIIYKYLLDQGWTECGSNKCKQPLPPSTKESKSNQASSVRISDLGTALLPGGRFASEQEALERAAVEKGDVGPFVTRLVERLSDMGTDTLRQRFGEGARDHLARLHELARFDIEDEQVPPETRRTFAVNRLVRAWLPRSSELGEEDRELRQIRETIGFVLDRTPWKFAIWRALVRGAARRPLFEAKDNGIAAQEAAAWLCDRIRRIACATDSINSTTWLSAWPEIDRDDGHTAERTDEWQHLYLSFLRAVFWRSLAETVRELGRYAKPVEDDESTERVPSPFLWTARAVGDGRYGQAVDDLGRIDEWVEILYPAANDVKIDTWPWELDEFVGAVLAVHTTTELAQAWRSTKGPGSVLRVPESPRLEGMPKATRLLSRTGRLQQKGSRRNRKLDLWALANVQLGRWDQGLGSVLFPPSGKPRIRQAERNAQEAVAAGFSLGCFKWIGLRLANRAAPKMDEGAGAFDRNAFVLHDYDRARRVIVGQTTEAASRPTVHRLLWGRPTAARLNGWQMAQWEIPAVGLPLRVAAALFSVVRETATTVGWECSLGPLTWLIDDDAGVLVAGRCEQLEGLEKSNDLANHPQIKPETDEELISVRRSTAWEVLPHAAFYLPFESAAAGRVHVESYVLYCDVLLLLTLLDGAERILDILARWGIRGTPFVDRWGWRSRIHLPLQAWKSIESILRWSASPGSNITSSGRQLVDSLAQYSRKYVSWEDFRPERIDIGLSPRRDLDIVRTVRPAGELIGPELPPELHIDETQIMDVLVARVGQVAAWPNNAHVVRRFPRIPSTMANLMIEQVANVFLAPAQAVDEAAPQLVVLPELSIPQQEVGSLRDLVRAEGKGAVAGLYWRALKPAFRPSRPSTPTQAWLVNEAEVVVPVGRDNGPPTVRWFRVRKPVSAHTEDGLARALSKVSGTRWRMLRGNQWFRFVHPNWGDFTVAICADLIESAPWRAFRGELLHLLMVAFNKDVDLFDSLTWVRAYENYVNVVSVNHGRFGGSFLWTPRRTHERELARLRGGHLVLTADVQLPVKELLGAQKAGTAQAIEESAKKWRNEASVETKFKTPPPGFRRIL